MAFITVCVYVCLCVCARVCAIYLCCDIFSSAWSQDLMIQSWMNYWMILRLTSTISTELYTCNSTMHVLLQMKYNIAIYYIIAHAFYIVCGCFSLTLVRWDTLDLSETRTSTHWLEYNTTSHSLFLYWMIWWCLYTFGMCLMTIS